MLRLAYTLSRDKTDATSDRDSVDLPHIVLWEPTPWRAVQWMAWEILGSSA